MPRKPATDPVTYYRDRLEYQRSYYRLHKRAIVAKQKARNAAGREAAKRQQQGATPQSEASPVEAPR